MQEGACPHTSNVVLDFLQELFGLPSIYKYRGRFACVLASHGGDSWFDSQRMRPNHAAVEVGT